MNRGGYPAQALYPGAKQYLAAFLGGGAATDGSIPTDGVLTDTAAGLYPKAANMGLTLVYVSTGIYTATFSDSVKNILFAAGVVVDDGASPTTALYALVSKITPGATLTVRVYTPAGSLTDLGTSDLLILKVDAADTSAINRAGT